MDDDGAALDARRFSLWWIGGAAPIAAGLAGLDVHELVPGGSLECRCGARHDAPGRGHLIVKLERQAGVARLWLADRADADITDAPQTLTQRVVLGIGDARAEAVLARHLTLAWCSGLIGYTIDDLFRLLREARALELLAHEGEDAFEALIGAGMWLESRPRIGPAQVHFDGDFRLRDVSLFVENNIGARTEDIIFQMVAGDGGPFRISILAGIHGPTAGEPGRAEEEA